jgi:hypothetical protein
MDDESSPFGPLLRRLGRPVYYPAYGDLKHQQATESASRRIFGDRDLSSRILHETAHRAQRTGSSEAPPQPYPDAEAKVWLRFAQAEGAEPTEVQALKTAVARRYADRRS